MLLVLSVLNLVSDFVKCNHPIAVPLTRKKMTRMTLVLASRWTSF
jgi:hypothetical protein